MSGKEYLIRIVNSNDSGGVKTVELEFTKELKKRGFKVIAVIVGNGPTKNDYLKTFDAHVEILSQIPKYKATHLGSFLNILKAELISRHIANKAYDILKEILDLSSVVAITAQRPYYLKMSGILAQKIECLAVWQMPMSIKNIFRRYYLNNLIQRYNIFPIGNSEFTTRSLGVNNGYVVYPGFSPQKIFTKTDNDLNRLFGIPNTAKVFGVVARLSHDKAPDIVMEAFLKSEAFKGGAHLVFAGGPLDTTLGTKLVDVAKNRGKNQVHFLGHTDDVADVYSNIDVLINGRRAAEPFGISIVEAMAAGIPVITYNLGGPSETVIQGKTGWFATAPTVKAYSAAIDNAWHEQGAWPVMKEVSRQWAERFTVNKQVDRYLDILKIIYR